MHVSKSSAALNPLELTITPEKPEQNRSKIDIDISTTSVLCDVRTALVK